jgi:hypothetical protein
MINIFNKITKFKLFKSIYNLVILLKYNTCNFVPKVIFYKSFPVLRIFLSFWTLLTFPTFRTTLISP